MSKLEPNTIPEEPLSISDEPIKIPQEPSSPKEFSTPNLEEPSEEKQPEAEAEPETELQPEEEPEPEEEEEEEEDLSDIMEIGKHGIPLCPKHKIDASNFCLMENCSFALNCVLCVKEHEREHRVPEMNYALGLVLNENLADQFFDKSSFNELEYKRKIKDFVFNLKLTFNRKCDELETLLVERMETESHEFMLRKIRKFLDKSRAEYNKEKNKFSLLHELCSTFNDFLLLKKSDQVPTVEDEINVYKALIEQFKKTISLSFEYLNNKICRIPNEPVSTPAPVQAPPPPVYNHPPIPDVQVPPPVYNQALIPVEVIPPPVYNHEPIPDVQVPPPVYNHCLLYTSPSPRD